MLLLLLFLHLLPAGLYAQAGVDPPPGDPIRLPDVILRGEETSILLPPPPPHPLPLRMADLNSAWPLHDRSESPAVQAADSPAPSLLAAPLLFVLNPEYSLPFFPADRRRAPGRAALTYVPGFLFSGSFQEQAAVGNWSLLPALSVASADIWLQQEQETRDTPSRISAALKAVRSGEVLHLGLNSEVCYRGAGANEAADSGVLSLWLAKELSWRREALSLTEETRLLGSRFEETGRPAFSALVSESLALEAGHPLRMQALRGRAALQSFLDAEDGSSSLLIRLEALGSIPAWNLSLEAGGALRRFGESWKLFPAARILYAPAAGTVLRAEAGPTLNTPEIPGFLIRNSFSPLPVWQPEAVYRIACGARTALLPGLESDLEARYRWGSFYRPADPGWLYTEEGSEGTLTGRLLYRAKQRLRFELLGRIGLPLPGEELLFEPETLKGGMEIDFNKPLFTVILELLWGNDPWMEPDPVLSAWGEYYSGTAVSLRTDWYIGARHILTQGLYYTIASTGGGGELRILLGYGIRRTKE
jgi:hypothetical protein